MCLTEEPSSDFEEHIWELLGDRADRTRMNWVSQSGALTAIYERTGASGRSGLLETFVL